MIGRALVTCNGPPFFHGRGVRLGRGMYILSLSQITVAVPMGRHGIPWLFSRYYTDTSRATADTPRASTGIPWASTERRGMSRNPVEAYGTSHGNLHGNLHGKPHGSLHGNLHGMYRDKRWYNGRPTLISTATPTATPTTTS